MISSLMSSNIVVDICATKCLVVSEMINFFIQQFSLSIVKFSRPKSLKCDQSLCNL